jgi:ferric-dicitrate binding protein FerR (iron transport regulator)
VAARPPPLFRKGVERAVHSREVLAEATRWLVELETTDRLDDIWDEFDDWFQASAAHRIAYARVRRHWLRSSPSPSPPTYRRRYKSHWNPSRQWASATAWMSRWWLPLAAALCLLITLAELYQLEFPFLR